MNDGMTLTRVRTLKDSVMIKDGRDTIIKSSKASTIYFDDDETQKVETEVDESMTRDSSVINNTSRWEELQSRISSFHDAAYIKEEKQYQERISNAAEEGKNPNDQFRNKINRLLIRAKKLK